MDSSGDVDYCANLTFDCPAKNLGPALKWRFMGKEKDEWEGTRGSNPGGR